MSRYRFHTNPVIRGVKMLALAAVLVIAGCTAAATPVAKRTTSPGATLPPVSSPAPTPLPSPTTQPEQTPSAPPAPLASPSPAPPMPSVHCLQGIIPSFQALVTRSYSTLLYDVGDPLHPHLVCSIANTSVHILTGTSFEYLVPNRDGTTSVMLHALGSNDETVAATFHADLYHIYYGWIGSVAWLPGKDRLAYLAGGGTDAQGFGVTDAWLATPTGRTKIYSYSVPGKDAFGRPGFAPVTLGFSPDGAYLAAGWNIALTPPRVFRLADHADVTPALPSDYRFAFWAKTGLTLYMVTATGVYQWTPGGAVTPVSGTVSWILDPSLSPDGGQVAFTSVTSTRDVRAYVYDLKSASSRLLSDQPRSSAMFVKAGWVWEEEEQPCVPATGQNCFDPTVPDGNVLAFELATGRESRVTFATGESPPGYSQPGDLWPMT